MTDIVTQEQIDERLTKLRRARDLYHSDWLDGEIDPTDSRFALILAVESEIDFLVRLRRFGYTPPGSEVNA